MSDRWSTGQEDDVVSVVCEWPAGKTRSVIGDWSTGRATGSA